MKTKLFFILAILFAIPFMNGCFKEDEPKEELIITGDWYGTLTVITDVFDFELVVNQVGSQLQGDFIFYNTEYTFPYPLLPSSMITGNTVFINFDEETYYQFRLKGTLNASGDAMQGTYTLNGASHPYYTWEASKVSKK